jgi:hypothetical protein
MTQNWDYNSLGRYAQKAIKSAIKKGIKHIDNDDLEDIREELKDDGITGLTKTNKTYTLIKEWLTNHANNVELQNELYSFKDGLITKFSEAGANMKTKYSGMEPHKISNLIEPSALGLTVAATKDKEEIHLNIKELLAATGSPNEPFNDKDKEILNRMLDLIGLDVKTLNFAQLQGKTSALIDDTKKLIATFDPQSAEERKSYYEYWEERNKDFRDFARTMFGLHDASKELEGLEDNTLMKEIQEKIKKLKIPNYIIQFPSVPIKQMESNHLARKLLVKYIKTIDGLKIPEGYDIYDDKESPDASVRVDPNLSDEKRQTEQERASFDQTVVDEVESERQEKLDRIRKETQDVDILFGIQSLATNSKVKDVYSDETIERAKQEIYQGSKTKLGEEAFEEYKEILENDVDEFFERYKLAQDVTMQEDKRFHLAMMDDSSNVNYIQTLIKGQRCYVEYISLETGFQVTTIPFSEYQEAVDFINRNVKKFFKVFAEVTGLITSYDPITGTKAKPTPKGVRGAQEQYYGGGSLPSRRGRLPEIPKTQGPIPEDKTRAEFDEEMKKDLDDAKEKIINYYVEPLNSRWLVNNDKPLFYSDSHLLDIQLVISEDPVSLAILDMMDPKSIDPDIHYSDLSKLAVALSDLDKGTSIRLNSTTINKWSSFTKALINLFAGVSRKKPVMKKLYRNIKAVVGSILYEIGQNSVSPEELEKKKWPADSSGKLLSEWNRIRDEEGATLPNIMGLITHPKFESMVERKGIKKLDDSLRILKATIRKNNSIKLAAFTSAMLDAKDLLLKAKGEKIYKGYMDPYDADDVEYVTELIMKENRVDLYAKDIELIVGYNGSFNTVAENMGLNEDVIYKVKGLFR